MPSKIFHDSAQFARTVRDSLVDPAIHDETDDLPGDGSRADLGMLLIVAVCVVSMVGLAVALWPGVRG